MQQKPFTLRQFFLTAALGALAVPALAQTNVTFTGLADAYTGSIRMSGDAGRKSVVNSGGLTTSWFGFKGNEDLGGGLKAKFALTSFIQVDDGTQGRFKDDTMYSRDANVGLTGSFGGISLGRDLAPNFLPTILFNPYGDSFAFSPLILQSDVSLYNSSRWTNSLAGDTGWSNEVIYSTPNFGGLTANIHYQFGEVAGDKGKNNVGANALYFNGPLALTAFYHRVQINNPTNTGAGAVHPTYILPPNGETADRQTAWMVGGSYDLNVVKLFATYGKTSHDIDLEDKTGSLGASVPVGQGKVLAAWAQTKRSGAAVGNDVKRNTASLGYDYDMSKRTDLYAIYMYDKVTGSERGNSFGVGVRHRF